MLNETPPVFKEILDFIEVNGPERRYFLDEPFLHGELMDVYHNTLIAMCRQQFIKECNFIFDWKPGRFGIPRINTQFTILKNGRILLGRPLNDHWK